MKSIIIIFSAIIAACSSLCHKCADKDLFVHLGNGKHVKLIKFSEEQMRRFDVSLETPAEKDYSKGINPKFQVDLGMANVPVLDQGAYGTCVTFSSTAALDAILAQGDFVSQQCSLELDYGLNNDYWDGAYYPSQIIDTS